MTEQFDPEIEQSELIDVLDRVRRGLLTPEQAETWAKAAGRPPFVPPIGSARNPVERSNWPVALAAAWVLTRELDAALKAWMAYKVWGRALWREAPWHKAQTELCHKLSCGELHATGVKIKSEVKERIAILPVEWHDLTWRRLGDVDIISFRDDRHAKYQDVLIDAADIYRLWPRLKLSEVKSATTAAAERRCYDALVQKMRASPASCIPKARLKLDCCLDVSTRAFDRAFAKAAEEANAPAWRAPGRPKKPAPKNAAPE